MSEDDKVIRGNNAKRILDDPLWAESWQIYIDRLQEIIRRADSHSVEVVMQAKRLMSAADAAKKHMEAIFQDGKMSAATIELEEKRKRWPWAA